MTALSHAELVEAIEAGRERVAAEALAADERICVETDVPSALMLALYRGMPTLAGFIARRRQALTVFEWAACGDAAGLERLLAADPAVAHDFAADGFTALHLAGFFGHAHAAALLLQALADPRARARNATLACPLHSAAATGDVGICHMLLHAGAHPDAFQQGGYTPLHAAALHGNLPLASLLLSWGADASRQAEDGRTAATVARQAGHFALADRLDSL